MAKQAINVAALAAALKRFLAHRPGAYGLSSAGYWNGRVPVLFEAIVTNDFAYYAEVARPHSAAQLASALRSNAAALHATHAVVVTNLEGNRVMLGLAEGKT